jgi:hypothetical protein
MKYDTLPDMVYYTILYTHGPSLSVDHLYVMRNIYDKQYTNKRKEEKQYIYDNGEVDM